MDPSTHAVYVANSGSGTVSVITPVSSATTTTTAVTSSANPSTAGQAVTYTATVSPAPNGGTVAFTDSGATITGCGAQSVDTTTGKATCQVTYASPGSHSITATYGGDNNFSGSSGCADPGRQPGSHHHLAERFAQRDRDCGRHCDPDGHRNASHRRNHAVL